MNFCDQMTACLDLQITISYALILAEQFLLKKFFDLEHGLDCDEMNVFLDQMTTYFELQITLYYPLLLYEQLCENNFFNTKLSLGCDEMNVKVLKDLISDEMRF